MTLELAERIAHTQTWLDAVSDRVQPTVRQAIARTGRGQDVLDGVWLGVPLHPAVTDVPVGALTATVALDAVGMATRSRMIDRQADGALAVYVAGAVGAAATGAADWRYLRGENRRIATAHALLNVVGLAFNAASLGLRIAHRRAPARMASMAGFAVAGLAAHLGGELSFGLGVRVNESPPTTKPAEFEPVMDEAQLVGNSMHEVTADGQRVLLTRSSGGAVCAISGVCSHFGGPLAKGQRDGDVVTCPWHGSRFDVCTGEVRGGPAVFPQPTFEARLRDGKVEVRRAP